MNRNLIHLIAATAVLGLASTSYADTTQEELQPKATSAGVGLVRKTEATSFNPRSKRGEAPTNEYRFLTDYNP